jgi:glycosyltransferase involved in cell wall biosynthesis
MKVLIDHSQPFLLSHGGFQIQIEQTYGGLREAGIGAEYLRWWDDRQPADIIHYFGRPSIPYVTLAQAKGIRIVMAELLTGLGSRSPRVFPFQKAAISLARATLPGIVTGRFAWDAYKKVEACIAGTPWEAHLMSYIFGAPEAKVHVVLNGVEEVFRQSPATSRGQWLVCTATIAPRKRVLELAQAALAASTPIWIIGKPYADSDAYAQQFFALARQNPKIVRYEGAVSDRTQLARIYREARGFVLLSTMESLSLSSGEAAACECPMLLSDLPWARTAYQENAYYCPIASISRTADCLRQFYDSAPQLKIPPKPPSWIDIGKQLKGIYEDVLSRK